jgi:mgtE-like transporter|tara:strand:- start:412 stop:1626 length:1215 start_codon:yes stop_codon:yes gene_type:complete
VRTSLFTSASLRIVDSRQRFVALTVGVIVASSGGLVLAASESTLSQLPGLLLLLPGAIALRGNIFGSMGSRLGTAAHMGTFGLSYRIDSVLIQNLLASGSLSIISSLILAVLAKGTASAFGLSPAMSLADFIVISVLGGVLSSIALAAVTVVLSVSSVKHEWDLDNVVAPLVTTTGDLLTVPSLIFVSYLANRSGLTNGLALVIVLVSIIVLIFSLRTSLERFRRVFRQSIPVLGLAVILDLMAGFVVEKRLKDLLEVEAVLILIPAFLGIAGALGGILSSRLSTQFHLGMDDASPLPSRSSIRGAIDLSILAVPIFIFSGVVAHLIAVAADQSTPGITKLILISAIAGSIVTLFVVAVSYYTTMGSFRFGLDPDTYGIPVVASSLDLVGAFTVILAMVLTGVI